MDPAAFTEPKTGELVRVGLPDPDWAFVPAPLPPAFKPEDSLQNLLLEAYGEVMRLDGIGRSLPNPNLLLMPLQQREAITSSEIEGTHATAQQLLFFELEQPEAKDAHDDVNDWREVFNYGRALREGRALAAQSGYTRWLACALHQRLLEGVRGDDKTPGIFRKRPVQIGSDRRFVPPPPERVNDCFEALERYMNLDRSTFHPLLDVYLIHYQFEAIHPFNDGNGRVGRLLMAIMTAARLRLAQPWLYMSAYFERFKDEYMRNLFNISAKGAWQQWLEFCLTGTREQAKESCKRCELLRGLKDAYLGRLERKGSVRLGRIIEGLFERPIVTITEMSRRFDIGYHTAQSDAEKLVKARILTPMPGTRPKAYEAKAIFLLAYEPLEKLPESIQDLPKK